MIEYKMLSVLIIFITFTLYVFNKIVSPHNILLMNVFLNFKVWWGFIHYCIIITCIIIIQLYIKPRKFFLF